MYNLFQVAIFLYTGIYSFQFRRSGFRFLSGSGFNEHGSETLGTGLRAVDPHSFYADPDPAVFLNADPDPYPGPGPA